MLNLFHKWRALTGLVFACALPGCKSAQPSPIDVRAIGSVQADIKRQIGIYLLAAQTAPVYARIDGQDTNILGNKKLFWCGSGNVDYDISAVKAELTTSLVLTGGASLALTPPIPIPVSGTFSFSRSTQNSQVLDYNLWPFGMALQDDEFKASRPDADLAAAPIAQVLLNLRQAQISGATRIDYLTGKPRLPQPCFVNYDPSKPASDAGNSFTIGLSITTGATGAVSVGVSAMKFEGSASSTSATGHSLKVTFVQRDLSTLQKLRDYVDSVCKGPDGFSQKCTDATRDYDHFRVTGELGKQLRVNAKVPQSILDDIKRFSVGVQEVEQPTK